MEFLKKYKDYLYYYLAEKNWGVRREYGPYVDSHQEEHLIKRWKHWWMLFRLNWHYRILRKDSFLYLKPSVESISVNKRRLPYLGGAESEISKRGLSVHLAMRMLQYEVISFDVFDTLLFRPFSQPTTIFHIIGKRLNIPEFYQTRIEAERIAHEIAIARTGNREICIDDIYDVIEKKIGLSKDLGIKTEIEVELQYCIANPYMKQVYQMLLEHNKTIIFVSDMYLNGNVIEQILQKNGFNKYKKVYVSSDYRSSKHSKGLYKYVLNDFQGKKIVHIGDNLKSDKQCAQACGIDAIHYKNINEIGNPYRADGMSELIGSAYKGIVNMHLHSGLKKYTPQYEYGFVCGGLYVFGFCNWIYDYCKNHGIEKILFLSRDGAIYKRVFDSFFSEIDSEYFLWSRIANTIYTFEKNGFLELKKNLEKKINSNAIYTFGEWLDSLGLDFLKKSLPEGSLNEYSLLVPEKIVEIEKFFHENMKLIKQEQQKNKNEVINYIESKISGKKKIAIVDVGWVGSSAMGLQYLIKHYCNDEVQVFGLQCAAISSNTTNISANILDKTISAYMFTQQLNRINYDSYVKTNKGLNHMFFEALTQAQMPSFGYIDQKSKKFCFNIPEVENYSFIEQIHEGIYDFCVFYHNIFKEDTYMYNISGYDAYLPFRFISRSIKYCKNVLGNFVFPNDIGLNKNHSECIEETISDRITQAGYKF